MVEDQGELTEQQKMFCREYIKDFHGARAAAAVGYSKKTASAQASRLVTKVKVQSYLAECIQKRAEKTETDAEYVLINARTGFETIATDIMEDDWTLKPLSEWPKHALIWLHPADIKELFAKSEEGKDELIGYLKKVKWPDKVKLLEVIGKHVDVKAFHETVDHNHRFDPEAVRSLREIIREAKKKEVNPGGTSS